MKENYYAMWNVCMKISNSIFYLSSPIGIFFVSMIKIPDAKIAHGLHADGR